MSKLKNFSIIILMLFLIVSPTLYSQVIKDDFRVNDDVIGGTNNEPNVEILENGEEIIVWADERNGELNTYGQAYDGTGAPVNANFKVSTNNGAYFEGKPSLACYGDSILVIWAYRDGQWLLSDGSQSGSAVNMNSGSLYAPDVAVSDSGFFVVWYYNVSGKGLDIFLKRFAFNGDSLGPRIVINDDVSTENQVYPGIAMNNDGYFVVVWHDDRNVSTDIYGQRFDPSGSPIGGNFLINDDVGDYDQYHPSCAMDFAGNFTVVWYDNRDGGLNIYGQRFNNTGNKIGSNFLINDDGGSYSQYYPSCAMDSAGISVVVWQDYRDGRGNIYGQRFDNAGNFLNGNFRIDTSSSSGHDNHPKVSMNKNNFVVTWYQTINNYSSVYKRRFDNDGTPVGDQILVNELEGTASQLYPIVDMNTGGSIVVTWADYRDPQGIYFQQLDALGNKLGENIRVASGHTPDIAIAEDSSFVITYDYSNDIYYQQFDHSGNPIGSPFVISDTIDGSRSLAAVDIDSDNNTVVAWSD